VNPQESTIESYQEQVRNYLSLTGVERGLVVFMTSGKVIEVVAADSSSGGVGGRGVGRTEAVRFGLPPRANYCTRDLVHSSGSLLVLPEEEGDSWPVTRRPTSQ
jgi:hypothetical protein